MAREPDQRRSGHALLRGRRTAAAFATALATVANGGRTLTARDPAVPLLDSFPGRWMGPRRVRRASNDLYTAHRGTDARLRVPRHITGSWRSHGSSKRSDRNACGRAGCRRRSPRHRPTSRCNNGDRARRLGPIGGSGSDHLPPDTRLVEGQISTSTGPHPLRTQAGMTRPRSRRTATHWGVYEVTGSPDGPELRPSRGDPDPAPITDPIKGAGAAQTRILKPAVRHGYLIYGARRADNRRGSESFVEVDWDEALDLAAAELARVRNEAGNQAIYAGSYGWAERWPFSPCSKSDSPVPALLWRIHRFRR